ncbi:aldo/keto reductase [Saccharopolyspora pogona]|uniref:aldo/keto reductase n=1 Tax=Saccharopolyspora pogona TaxID=333966 RepID=UPI0016879318|nr:aldo/keto reductase [Saccharopolyspora pogona]
MEQRPLGTTGLKVSALGLGTSTWGTTTDPDDAAEQLRAFVEVGGTLVDTADVYGGGSAEEIVGQLLGKVVPRDNIVLATKAVAVLDDPDRRQNASREHLLSTLDKSLTKLRTDYIDLWQLHAWDQAVPLEETLAATDTAVRAGKVRHVGVCNYTGWQTAKAATWKQINGVAPLASCQLEYSLLERGIEREVVPAALDAGMAVLPWAPLGRGVLTGKYRGGVPADRENSRFFKWYVAPRIDDRSARIVETLAAAADELAVPLVAVALAWVRDRPGVAAPLVGARTVEQLRESLSPATLALELPAEIRRDLDAASAPHIGYPESGI